MKDNIYKLTLNQIDALVPFLKEYYGYTEELLLLDIIDTYTREVADPKFFAMTKRLDNENIGDYLKRMREKSKEEEEDSRSMNEIVRSENYNLKLNFGEFSFEELKKKCVLPEHEYNDVWYAVLFIVTYLISKETKPFKGRPDYISEVIDWDLIAYNEYVRPDMLKLFLFQDAISDKFNSKRKSQAITIKCGKDKIEISNAENWFMQHLYLYLDEFLEVKDVKEADAELDTYKKKQGRTALNPLVNRVIWGTYNLLKSFSIFTSTTVSITGEICNFIESYLLYLDLIDKDSPLYKNNNQIRATINYLIKSNYNPYLWTTGFFADDKRPEYRKDYTNYW